MLKNMFNDEKLNQHAEKNVEGGVEVTKLLDPYLDKNGRVIFFS